MDIEDNLTQFPATKRDLGRFERAMVSANDIKPALNSNYLVKGWLGRDGLSVLFGESNSGKSLVAMDLALHIASGVDWMGCRVKQGNVLYIAAEGGDGVDNRLSALVESKSSLLGAKNLFRLSMCLELSNWSQCDDLCSFLEDKQFDLIIVDTLARVMGGDENLTKDMNAFISNIDFIRERTGAHVMLIHHSGKENKNRARGSSALRAAVDTEIKIEGSKISSTKQRDMKESHPISFNIVEVERGKDSDGDAQTSAIVTWADSEATKFKPIAGQEEIAWDILVELANTQIPDSDDVREESNTVPLAKWRSEFIARMHAKKNVKLRSLEAAFNRAKAKLRKRNAIRIGEENELVWIVERPRQTSKNQDTRDK